MGLNKFYLRAVDRVNIEDWDGAISDINKGLLLEHDGASGSAGLYALRASLWEKKGDLERAVTDLSRSIELAPSPSAYGHRARILVEQNKMDDALEDSEKAIDLDPENYVSHQIRGEVRTARKEYEPAIGDFTRSMELQPDTLTSLEHRAKAYRALGKTDLAEADEKRFEIERAKHRKSFLAMTEDLTVKYPEDPNSYFWRGRIRLDNEEYDLAIADLTKALEVDKSDNADFAEALKLRARAFRCRGDVDLAVADELSYQAALNKKKRALHGP